MGRALLLTVEFDGTAFFGWQRQPDRRTVQQVVEEALGRLAGTPCTAIAAGRTDAGVHALAMPVSTTMPEQWTATALLRALNAVLPRDVAVSEIRAITPGRDARRAAESRRYRYDVGVDAACRSPFRGRTEWPLGRPLDLELVEQPIDPGPVEQVAQALARLRGRTSVALAADESVVSLPAARTLVAAGAVDALVVKPARVGGPLVTLAIARLAHEAGVAVIVSTLLETGVGLLAAMATAAMLPGGDGPGSGGAPAHGLGTGGALATDLVGGRSLVSGGRHATLPGSGMGLDGVLDRAAIERFTVERCGVLA